MHNAKSIIGMTVVNLSNGERIGRVRDLLIDPEQRQVAALIIETRGLFRSTRAVTYEGVRHVGKDAVVITDGSFIVNAKRHPVLRPLLGRGIVILGKPVMTEGGWLLGTIRDVVLDGSSGAIHGYLMYNLAMKGLPRGFTPILSAQETLVVGRHLAMVTDRAEYLLKEALDEALEGNAEAVVSRGWGPLGVWNRLRGSRNAAAPSRAGDALELRPVGPVPLKSLAEDEINRAEAPDEAETQRDVAA